jgi:ATP-dependent Lon protease
MTDVEDVMTVWVSVPEASARLDVTERTIFRRVSNGKLQKRETSDGRVEVLIDVIGESADVDRHGTVMTQPESRHDAVMTTDDGGHDTVMTSIAVWREDLCQQVADLAARLTRADEAHAVSREEAARREAASAQREELSKARIIDLERELTMRDSRIVDLSEQNQVLEAKVRETLEERAEENGQLANRIADLVAAHTEMQSRVVELQPVADRVPMLQAAVEEKDASLSEREQALQKREQELGNIRQDIDAIASRPVTGPVFRLLTKGKLRR